MRSSTCVTLTASSSSVTCVAAQRGSYCYCCRSHYTSSPFAITGVPAKFSVHYNSAHQRFEVEWEKTGEPILITGGTIVVKGGTAELCKVVLEAGAFKERRSVLRQRASIPPSYSSARSARVLRLRRRSCLLRRVRCLSFLNFTLFVDLPLQVKAFDVSPPTSAFPSRVRVSSFGRRKPLSQSQVPTLSSSSRRPSSKALPERSRRRRTSLSTRTSSPSRTRRWINSR